MGCRQQLCLLQHPRRGGLRGASQELLHRHTACTPGLLVCGAGAAQRVPGLEAAGQCVREERFLLGMGTWGQVITLFFHISLPSKGFPHVAFVPCLLHGSLGQVSGPRLCRNGVKGS